MKHLLLALLIATQAHATVRVWSGEPGNRRFHSANGQFSVVQPVKNPSSPKFRLELYDGRQRVTVVDSTVWPEDVLVLDSGRAFVVLHGAHYQPDGTLMSIFGRNGSLIRGVRAGDLFSDDDLEAMRLGSTPAVTLAGEQIHLRFPSGTVRLDAPSGANLDPGTRDFLPVWRAWTVPDARIPEDRKAKAKMECAAGIEPSDAIRIAPRELHARATHRPLPIYPPVAKKARVGGTMWIEVVVSQSGEVVCMRTVPLPFGLQQAAEEAVRQWRFEPYLVDGKRAMFISDIELQFARITRDELAKIAEAP
ncbi:MAG TPA: energy transducer TonB [Thermoanaerobaculia bacterium]